MVGDLEKSSFSNIEQQSLEFVKYTLDPSAAAESGLPTLTHTLRVFDGAGVFQHTTGSRTICKELGSVLFAGNERPS